MNFFRLLPVVAVFLLAACTADELPEPRSEEGCDAVEATYDLNIREIIDLTCAYSGCHPEYNTYAGVLPDLENGSFKSRVIDLAADPVLGMPRDDAPAGRQKDLTEAQLMLIACWLAGDYPEN